MSYPQHDAPSWQAVALSQLDLDSLRAAFPNWRFGGVPGHWYAVRGGVEAASGPRSLLRRCLSASTLEALADKLCLQHFLDGLSDEALANVWQQAKLPQASDQAAS
jgi:hypothetical protein